MQHNRLRRKNPRSWNRSLPQTRPSYQTVGRNPAWNIRIKELPIPARRAQARAPTGLEMVMFNFESVLLYKFVLVFHYRAKSLMPRSPYHPAAGEERPFLFRYNAGVPSYHNQQNYFAITFPGNAILDGPKNSPVAPEMPFNGLCIWMRLGRVTFATLKKGIRS